VCGYVSYNSNVTNSVKEISSDSEFRRNVDDIYENMTECYGKKQADILKLYGASISTNAKANEYRPRTTQNKTAASFNLMRRLVGGKEWDEDVQS
jgi:hypothetical protein